MPSADDVSGHVEEVPAFGGGFIRRRVDETDDEFSARAARERAQMMDDHKKREMKAESPLEKFKRLWS